jgi:hypothetical protein
LQRLGISVVVLEFEKRQPHVVLFLQCEEEGEGADGGADGNRSGRF